MVNGLKIAITIKVANIIYNIIVTCFAVVNCMTIIAKLGIMKNTLKYL